MIRGPEPAGAQRLPRPPALDDQQWNVGPPPPQLLGNPHERISALIERRVDERHVA